MYRVEAAVSLDHEYFMIITGDNNNNGYFSIYPLSTINSALNSHGTTAVDIRNYSDECCGGFKLSDLSGINGSVGSLQGFDFSFNGSTGYIYISSQYSPNSGDGGQSRKIVKIPWGDTNPDDWEEVNLRQNPGTIDAVNPQNVPYRTELEGLQLMGDNDVYLTVAYHDPSQDDLTVMNRIYRVNWSSNI